VSAISAGPFLSDAGDDAVRTNVDSASSASSAFCKEEFQAIWQSAIDRTLKCWLNNPTMLEDDDIEIPTKTTIRLALDYAEDFCGQELPPPSRIVPDGSGGIVFERRIGNEAEIVHFWDDGAIEYQQFDGSTLVRRVPF
jgi:hypothetical protein